MSRFGELENSYDTLASLSERIKRHQQQSPKNETDSLENDRSPPNT